MDTRAIDTLQQQLEDLRDKLARDGWDRRRGLRLLHSLKRAHALLDHGAVKDTCTALLSLLAKAVAEEEVAAVRLHALLDLTGQLAAALGEGDGAAPSRNPPVAVEVVAVGDFEQDLEPLRTMLAGMGVVLVECPQAENLCTPLGANHLVLADMEWLQSLTEERRHALAAEAVQAASWIVLSAPDANFSRQVELLRLGVGHIVERPLAPQGLATLIEELRREQRGDHYRVMLVDDAQEALDMLAAVLTEAGMDVLPLDDPLLAWDLIDEYRPDVLVLAVEMAACRGPELVALLRQKETCAQLPAIYLAASTDRERRLVPHHALAEDFLPKSGDPAALVAAVLALARRYRRLQRVAVARDPQTDHASGSAGSVPGHVGTVRDIADDGRVAPGQDYAKQVLAQIIDGTPIPTFVIDAEHRVTQWNRACELVTGVAAADVVGTKDPWKAFYATPRPVLADLIVNDDRAAMAAMEHYYTGSIRQSSIVRGASEAEGYFPNMGRWLSFLAAPLRDDTGRIVGAIETLQDITERKQAEASLRVAAIAFESQEGMMITDANGIMVRVNQAFTRLTGYSAEEAVGRTPALFKSGRHDDTYYRRMWDTLKEYGHWQGEIWNRRKNGKVYAEMLTISSVIGPDGQVSNYIGTFSDISRNSEAQAEIHRLAFYDPLTQLPNRRLLLDRLQQAITACSRNEREGALLFIDLDNFKVLNDTLGHDKGDLLLQQVAQRLSASVREGDTVARLGGDEFVVMLEGLDPSPEEAAPQAKAVGEKILAALNQPYQLAEHPHHSTPSIGVTLFGETRDTVDDLLKRADFAMYQSKAAGRNTLRFFDPDMQAVVTARASLEAVLRQGLQQEQFLLHYQAQVDGSGQLTGVEALVRWQHPERGMVPPGEFIPLAEDTGLILPLGQWVLEAACAQLVNWARQPAMKHLSVAVNVSARQFHHFDFVQQVLATLERSGANPSRLKLELTESLLLADVEDVIAKMSVLKAQGVCFSLDDFGTGYSSLTYLKRLPLDQLKIDQSFVRDVLTDPNDAAIAKAIITLGQSLGLAVIAEGVETEGQRGFLSSHGCDAYQGFLFGRPCPAQALAAVGHGRSAPAS